MLELAVCLIFQHGKTVADFAARFECGLHYGSLLGKINQFEKAFVAFKLVEPQRIVFP